MVAQVAETLVGPGYATVATWRSSHASVDEPYDMHVFCNGPFEADPDGGAVVDAACRTHGVDRLVVADASVMPEIPAANTNIPTIMLAERVSTRLIQTTGSSSVQPGPYPGYCVNWGRVWKRISKL